MELLRAKSARSVFVAGYCASAAFVVLAALPAPAAAQDGTVAVTGDGLSATLKSKSKGAGKASPSNTETASREPIPNFNSKDGHSIVVLVNDDPITGYEVQQRAMMLAGSDIAEKARANFQAVVKDPHTTERLKAIFNRTIQENEGKSRDEVLAIFEKRKKQFGEQLQKEAVAKARASSLSAVKKKALDELIDERLKLQEAKKQKITVDKGDIDKVIASIAQRNNMSLAEFDKRVGSSITQMKTRIRATLSWNEVVKKRFAPFITVSNKDVDRLMATTSVSDLEDDVELDLQRVRIAMPAKLEENGVAKRIKEAENVRSKFSGCSSTRSIAIGVPGAKFENLGKKRSSTISEPARSLLLNASDGEMLPPMVGDGAVELWVVCGREAVKTETEKRNRAEGELKQKEFEVMAQRYLKDLREDAHIEYR
jgi:peptidyl-prolyl cis-trans isomerase SurA